jgi:hypothetical protein
MAYVTTQYLRHFFPNAVRDYRQLRDLTDIRFSDDDKKEIVCLCPWQIEHFRQAVDVLWNSASFSEMTTEIVGNYAKHVRADHVCLMMNKSRDSEKTLSPASVIACFPNHRFSSFSPTVEKSWSRTAYALGSHRDSEAMTGILQAQY